MNRDHELAQVADNYRQDGYRVITRPAPSEIPAFARGHDVDLVAYKQDEKVLVRVKANLPELRGDQDAIPLARLVTAQPDWRFDLVVVNAEASSDQSNLPKVLSGEDPIRQIALHPGN